MGLQLQSWLREVEHYDTVGLQIRCDNRNHFQLGLQVGSSSRSLAYALGSLEGMHCVDRRFIRPSLRRDENSIACQYLWCSLETWEDITFLHQGDQKRKPGLISSVQSISISAAPFNLSIVVLIALPDLLWEHKEIFFQRCQRYHTYCTLAEEVFILSINLYKNHQQRQSLSLPKMLCCFQVKRLTFEKQSIVWMIYLWWCLH